MLIPLLAHLDDYLENKDFTDREEAKVPGGPSKMVEDKIGRNLSNDVSNEKDTETYTIESESWTECILADVTYRSGIVKRLDSNLLRVLEDERQHSCFLFD